MIDLETVVVDIVQSLGHHEPIDSILARIKSKYKLTLPEIELLRFQVMAYLRVSQRS